jgi:acetyl-CoA C-acetyltransferase
MEAYIIDGVFTPRASVRKGVSAYTSIHPQQLMASCFSTLGDRQPEIFPRVGAAYIGCVSEVNDQGANLARNAVLAAGMDQSVAAATMNMCCGSGLQTVNIAAAVAASEPDSLVLAGGVESMSRVKMASDGGGMDGNNLNLREKLHQVPQGICADFIASSESIDRSTLDEFALESQKRATRASQEKYFHSLYSYVKGSDGQALLNDEDHIRPDASLAALGALPAAFAGLGEQLTQLGVIGGDRPLSNITYRHTAGNSSGIADGAGALLIAGNGFVRKFNLKPRARIIGTRASGSDPITMLSGPADCCEQLLKAQGMTVKDVDLWEINEAFAVVPLQTIRKLGISPEQVNIKGGSIARGHPLGATGAILLASMVLELEKENKSTGCVVLCVAGGQSVATLVERC